MSKNDKSMFSNANINMFGFGLVPLLGLIAYSVFGLGGADQEAQAPAPKEEPAQKRQLPTDRFIFRGGDYRSVIHTRSGWTSLGFDGVDPREYGRDYFGLHTRVGGTSLYMPFGWAPNAYPLREGRSTATYEIVSPPRRATEGSESSIQGYYESRAIEEVINGEYVRVYHPAVFEIDEDGARQLVKPEETTMEPKVRIVLHKVWVPGEPGGEK